jgi:pimeloyl-ACP methyl ester carboxylesterase
MEPIIFIPGLVCTAELFRDQLEELGKDRVARVADHRSDDTIPQIAARLLRDTPEERFSLVGLSMGGYIALEAYAQAPGRVARLALLDTSARADAPEAREGRLALMQTAREGRLDEVAEILWKRFVAEDRQEDAELKRRVFAMVRETGPDAFIRQQEAIMARRDHRAMLPGIEIPTLVLVGAEDQLTPPHLSQEMAEAIEWASLGIVPGCGHLTTMEKPAAVNRALRAWLES